MKTFHIITAFPNILDSYFNESILKRAQKNKLIAIKTHDVRTYSTDKHKNIDDTPYGGGPGMVLMAEPIVKALKKNKLYPSKKTSCIILLSPRGKLFSAKTAKRLAKYNTITFISGRYEGVDERIAENVADEIVSIGDYVLSGGELAAAVIIESIARFIPGVLGKNESATKEDHAQYTKPEIMYPDPKNKRKKWSVPKILLSGNHAKIKEWRDKN